MIETIIKDMIERETQPLRDRLYPLENEVWNYIPSGLNEQVQCNNGRIDILENTIHENFATKQALASLQETFEVLQNEVSHIASALAQMTEKLNQKVDLEIFEQKLKERDFPIDTSSIDNWYNNFLKELGIS